MSRTRLIAAFVAVLFAWPCVATGQIASPGEGEGAYRVDERDRRMRVGFPLHDRLWIGGGYAFGPQPSASLDLGISLSLDADFPDEEIWWQLRHDLGRMHLQPGRVRNFRFTLADGDYLRHDTSSTILIPRGQRDIRLPAPFDIAVLWTLADLHISTTDGLERADVVELAVLADFVRDENYRHRLAVGPCGRYIAERERDAWRHAVVPFAGLAALYGWEASSGRFAAVVRPTIEYAATIVVGAPVVWGWTARGQVRVEWVPLALNDLPLSILADAGVEHDLESSTTGWSANLGARLAVPLGM